MDIEQIEAQLKQMGNQKPQNSEFKANLKKRLDNLYLLNSENMKEKHAMDSAPGVKTKNRLPLIGRFGLTGIIFSLLLVLTAGTTFAYFVFPTVKETVNNLLGIEQEQFGYITVETMPAGAEIFINGESFGEAPQEIKLPIGNYSLKVSEEGYSDYYESFSIEKDEKKTVSVELEVLDPYLGWFIYSNEEYGFGFRYMRDWEIAENIGDDEFPIISLESDFAITAIKYQQVNGVYTEASEGYETVELANGQELYLEIVDENKVNGARMTLSTVDENEVVEILLLEMRMKDGVYEKYTAEEIRGNVIKFTQTIWLEGVSQDDEYELPDVSAENRFVWQVGGTVYSVNSVGEDLRNFYLPERTLGQSILSKDGSWIVYGDSSGGISIVDTLGQNADVLLSPISQQAGIQVYYSIHSGGWSPDSTKFIYKMDVWQGTENVKEANGIKKGFYVFDLETGTSQYLIDSSSLFTSNWSGDGTAIYGNRRDQDIVHFTLREYILGDSLEYNDYELDSDLDEISIVSSQFDVYSKEKIVFRGGGWANPVISLAHLENGKMIIDQELTDAGWTDHSNPCFSPDGNYIVVEGSKYYDLSTGKWKYVNGESYTADLAWINPDNTAFVSDSLSDSNGAQANSSIYLIDLAGKGTPKKVWQGPSSIVYVFFPRVDLN